MATHPHIFPLRYVLPALALLLVLISGCGGGGGSDKTVTPTGTTKFTFTWPTAARMRDLPDLTTANSLVVEIGGQQGLLQRPQTTLTIPGVPVGDQHYSVQAYASTDGSGTPLASTAGVMSVVENALSQDAPPENTLTFATGVPTRINITPIDTTPNFRVYIGDTIQLQATALDTGGRTLLIGDDGFSWNSSNPNIMTVNNGLLHALAEGTVDIDTSYGGFHVLRTLNIRDPNGAPAPIFSVSPSGDVSTNFYFDASGSIDPEDGDRLRYRWDWNSDGTYDTTYLTTRYIYHTFTTAGSYTVRLEVTDSKGKSATCTRTITVKVKLAVLPTTASLTLGQQLPFTAQVQGSIENRVTWKMQESSGAGTVSPNGIYTAPLTAGTYHVIATCLADSTVTCTIPVQVQATGGTVIVQ